MVPGRNGPGRHLVAVSAELAKTKPGSDREGRRERFCAMTIRCLCSIALRADMACQWCRGGRHGLCENSSQRKAIRPLLGLGCSPVLVSGNKACLPQMDREGAEGRLNPHSGREWLDHLEVAEEFPGAANIGGRNRTRVPPHRTAVQEREEGGICANCSQSLEHQPRLQRRMRLRSRGNQ